MGTVWLASNEALGSEVAIKLLRDDLDVPDLDARFEREARAAAFIEHPAIVRVLDFGRTETKRPFIVMQYLEGESLLELLHRVGPLPPSEAVRLLLPIVDALSHAHEKGVVHRDLKPDNILLARERGRLCPKLLDFGIAKVPSAQSSANLTRRGMVLGTVAYMAPEQARGMSDVDHRSDIWALCIVLYEAISGRVPFKGESFHATLRAICEDEVPALNKPPSDDRLWSIIRHGIAKDRRERCPSMRELGEALASWLQTKGVDDDATGARLVQTWGGGDGAFANGPMEAPAWSETAPVLPLVVTTKHPPSYAPSALSTTEVVAIQRRPFPFGALAVAAVIAGLGVLAWAAGQEPGGVIEYARNVAATHLPSADSKPEAPGTVTVAPKPAVSLEALPIDGHTAAAGAAFAGPEPARSRTVAAPAAKSTSSAAAATSPAATSPRTSVVLLEEDEGSGGWIRRALNGERSARTPARAPAE